MADVKPDAARVREHVEDEELRSLRDATRVFRQQPGPVRCPEDALGVPTVLPLPLEVVGELGVVAVRGGGVGHRRVSRIWAVPAWTIERTRQNPTALPGSADPP